MDFNIRSENELHYDNEQQVENTLTMFLQELDVIFNTEENTIFGNRDVGNDLESLLWSTTFNADYMTIKLEEKIKAHCYMNEVFDWSVEVKLLRGTVKDIALVEVIVKSQLDSSTLSTRKYQFR